MKVANISEKKLSEMNLPKLIYKYRDWEKRNHKTIITKRNVYMASPRSFEDPLDCKIPIRYDLLKEKEIFEMYVFFSKMNHPNWNRQRHRIDAKKWTKISPIKNKETLEKFQKDYFESFFDQFGVLSLTANPSNEEMWLKYSNQHKGFCVGFNTEIMFESLRGGGEVNYYDELPIIYPEPKHSIIIQHQLQAFSKLKKWQFEEEYRTHLFHSSRLTEEQRTITLPKEAYNKIILGKEMPRELKLDLINSIPDNLKHIDIEEL